MFTIKGTKEESQLMRWLAKAQAGEDRPILTTFHRRNGVVVSCDGFRLHAAPVPSCLQEAPETNELGQVNYRGKIKAGDFEADLDEVEGTYPDVAQLMPKGEPVAEFAVNPKYLREALAGLDTMAMIRVYQVPDWSDETVNGPITVHGVANKRFALIMTIYPHDPSGAYTPEF